MFKTWKLSILSLSLVGLSACGGGGGSSSDPTTTTPTPPPVAPTPTPTMQAANLQTAVAPTYATTSEEYNYFVAVNQFRTVQGLGPLNQDSHYDAAAVAHANYENLNAGTLGASHGEVSGYTGYTGNTPLARVLYQGGTANLVEEEMGLAEVIGAVGSGTTFASALIDSVYHRAGLLFQGVTTLGVSIGMSEATASSVNDLGYVTQQVNAGNYFGVYPVNGQTGVGLYSHPESPNPFPSTVNPLTQTGYPISVASQESTTLTITSFTVTQAGASSPMSATLIVGATDPNLAGNNNLAFLVANQNLLPNTVYTVNFVGTITGSATGTTSGIPVSQTWSFTTGSGN